jgi:hypothetical protein
MIDKETMAKEMAEFRKKINFVDLKAPEEIELLLSMTRDEMKLKSKQELSIDSARIAQYALYMSIQSNRLKSNLAWCNSNLDSIIGRELNNVQGYGLKEKSLIIIRNDPVATEVFRLKTLYETQYASIEDLDRKIEYYSTTLKNLTFSKD